MLGIKAADDIADPIGQSLSTYRQCAAEIEALIIKMDALIWGRDTKTLSNLSHHR